MATLRKILIGAIAFTAIATNVFAESQMWVASDTANRRTCPSVNCGVVGKLFYRESAVVYEVLKGWGRISKYYDASCKNGRSQYIDSGSNDCSVENGIENGVFAEWIRLDLLSKVRPADPAANSVGTARLVSQSDDFHRYESKFVTAAETLIASGQCTPDDLKDMGGFVKSSNKGPGIYFTYCNGGGDRIYLDVNTGRTFR